MVPRAFVYLSNRTVVEQELEIVPSSRQWGAVLRNSHIDIEETTELCARLGHYQGCDYRCGHHRKVKCDRREKKKGDVWLACQHVARARPVERPQTTGGTNRFDQGFCVAVAIAND